MIFGQHVETRFTDIGVFELRADSIDVPHAYVAYQNNAPIASITSDVCVFRTSSDVLAQDIVIDMLELNVPYDMRRFMMA